MNETLSGAVAVIRATGDLLGEAGQRLPAVDPGVPPACRAEEEMAGPGFGRGGLRPRAREARARSRPGRALGWSAGVSRWPAR